MLPWRALAERVQDLYERTCPIFWLQICYPFYYLARLALTEAKGVENAPTICVTRWAVSATCFWILWLQVRHLQPLAKVWQLLEKVLDLPRGRNSVTLVVPEHHLDTPLDIGLSRDEVLRRRKIYGWNELRHPWTPLWYLVKSYTQVCIESPAVPLEVRFWDLTADVLYVLIGSDCGHLFDYTKALVGRSCFRQPFSVHDIH